MKNNSSNFPILNIESLNILRQSSKVLESDLLILFPTETVYGIGGNALSDKACRKIYESKKRPPDNPLIVHFYSKQQIMEFVEFKFSPIEEFLISKFCPGPLTFLKEFKTTKISKVTFGQSKKMCFRIPSDKTILNIIKETNLPIAAPSANLSGRPSCTSAQDCLKEFSNDKNIGLLIDGGKTKNGLESTIIEVIGKEIKILRKGAITKDEISNSIENHFEVEISFGKGISNVPGSKYKHYSPKCDVFILRKEALKKKENIKFLFEKEKNFALVFCSEDLRESEKIFYGFENSLINRNCTLKRFESVKELGKGLYSVMREMEELNKSKILFVEIEKKGIGDTVMERIERSSEGKYYNIE